VTRPPARGELESSYSTVSYGVDTTFGESSI
jgi:hypothetical protein